MIKSQKLRIKLENPKDSSIGDTEVIKLGDNQFMLTMNHVFDEELCYGTKILTSGPSDKGVYVLEEIIEVSPFRNEVFILSWSFMANHMSELAKLVAEQGGYIESQMGGIVFISLPKDSTLNVAQEIDRLDQKHPE